MTTIIQLEAMNISALTREHEFVDAAKRICHLDLSTFSEKELEKFGRFVAKFNTEWTLKRLEWKKIAFVEGDTIRFSSVDKKSSWLSNFFYTLLFDQEARVCYPSLEHAYVAYKMKMAGQEFEHEAAVSMTPKEAKQFGGEFPSGHDDLTLAEMRRLVALKFSGNPQLQAMLASTKGSLEEFTSDSFWGSCLGTVEGPDSNHLGQILEAERTASQP